MHSDVKFYIGVTGWKGDKSCTGILCKNICIGLERRHLGTSCISVDFNTMHNFIKGPERMEIH